MATHNLIYVSSELFRCSVNIYKFQLINNCYKKMMWNYGRFFKFIKLFFMKWIHLYYFKQPATRLGGIRTTSYYYNREMTQNSVYEYITSILLLPVAKAAGELCIRCWHRIFWTKLQAPMLYLVDLLACTTKASFLRNH